LDEKGKFFNFETMPSLSRPSVQDYDLSADRCEMTSLSKAGQKTPSFRGFHGKTEKGKLIWTENEKLSKN